MNVVLCQLREWLCESSSTPYSWVPAFAGTTQWIRSSLTDAPTCDHMVTCMLSIPTPSRHPDLWHALADPTRRAADRPARRRRQDDLSIVRRPADDPLRGDEASRHSGARRPGHRPAPRPAAPQPPQRRAACARSTRAGPRPAPTALADAAIGLSARHRSHGHAQRPPLRLWRKSSTSPSNGRSRHRSSASGRPCSSASRPGGRPPIAPSAATR